MITVSKDDLMFIKSQAAKLCGIADCVDLHGFAEESESIDKIEISICGKIDEIMTSQSKDGQEGE